MGHATHSAEVRRGLGGGNGGAGRKEKLDWSKVCCALVLKYFLTRYLAHGVWNVKRCRLIMGGDGKICIDSKMHNGEVVVSAEETGGKLFVRSSRSIPTEIYTRHH